MRKSEALVRMGSSATGIAANQAFPGHVALVGKLSALARVAERGTSLAVWQRDVPEGLCRYLDELPIDALPTETRTIASSQSRVAVAGFLAQLWPEPTLGRQLLCHDVSNLVEEFAGLTGARRIRITIDGDYRNANPTYRAFDKRLRMVTSYRGMAMDWLPNEVVDRDLLESGDNGLICDDPNAQHRIGRFEVAMLKGEKFSGQAGLGLVCCDPAPEDTSNGRLRFCFDQDE